MKVFQLLVLLMFLLAILLFFVPVFLMSSLPASYDIEKIGISFDMSISIASSLSLVINFLCMLMRKGIKSKFIRFAIFVFFVINFFTFLFWTFLYYAGQIELG